MITHEFIKDVLLALDMKVSEDYFTKEFDMIHDYITQQEKKDNLLESYIELVHCLYDSSMALSSLNNTLYIELQTKRMIIINKILKIEEELKNE